jgi:8-oxo-dGTP pyrophosphatase MutT (NUDIX family)
VEEKTSEQKTTKTVRIFSAGGVVYKKTSINSDALWLVTKAAPSPEYPKPNWRLPKGWLDDEGDLPGPLASGKIKADKKDIERAAYREVKEEAGVETKIIKKVGTEKYFFTSRDGTRNLKFVTFFLMEWLSDASDGFGFETEEIVWLPYSDARKRLTNSGERKVLDQATKLLNSGIQESLI